MDWKVPSPTLYFVPGILLLNGAGLPITWSSYVCIWHQHLFLTFFLLFFLQQAHLVKTPRNICKVMRAIKSEQGCWQQECHASHWCKAGCTKGRSISSRAFWGFIIFLNLPYFLFHFTNDSAVFLHLDTPILGHPEVVIVMCVLRTNKHILILLIFTINVWNIISYFLLQH